MSVGGSGFLLVEIPKNIAQSQYNTLYGKDGWFFHGCHSCTHWYVLVRDDITGYAVLMNILSTALSLIQQFRWYMADYKNMALFFYDFQYLWYHTLMCNCLMNLFGDTKCTGAGLLYKIFRAHIYFWYYGAYKPSLCI